MSNQHFLTFTEEKQDDSSLGRARSMTKTLEKKGKAAIVPSTSFNSEFAHVVNRFKQLQEEYTKRRMTRKTPIITLKYSDSTDLSDSTNRIERLTSEKQQLTTTVSSLFKEMQHLKQQNQSMAQRIESLRKVLGESKSYTISLKQRNDNLASDMDFQSDLHEKQRRVWKTKIRTSVYDQNTIDQNDENSLDCELWKLIGEYESTIESQREQLKHKCEQFDQQRAVFEYEKNQQYAELSKEIAQLKNQRQQEIEELKLKIEQNNTELSIRKQENNRLSKTLEVTNNELNANRKLIEASRPLNATQTEQQLFQLEQDYLNLSEVLVACQHRVTRTENELNSKQHELDDANRLIDEQNKTMEEYKKSIQLLQSNLAESKSDQSDLINALQQEWEQSKVELMRYKEKCRQLMHEKDELLNANINIKPLKVAKQINIPNHQNAEMIVQVNELQRKLQQKEDEVKSQEMLMKQLMEQQKAFQKRNKTLVRRLKAIEKQNNLNANFNINEGDFTYFNNGAMPENITVDMKHLYDHYIRNPSLQTSDMISKIRLKSSEISSKYDTKTDYIIPEFNGQIRINSINTILYIIEDILIQRQNSIKLCNDKINEIFYLKSEFERQSSQNEIDKKHLYFDIKKLREQLLKYQYEINSIEEKQLLSFNMNDEKSNNLLIQLSKLKKENERIAQEFLQGANVWNAEKAIMSAERAQIENDISYISHNLEQLILERQQFEEEADEFQLLYVNLIGHLREKGMQIEVEYSEKNENQSGKYSKVAIKDDNFISQRRKRNTMRLKLYQATTQPAALKEIDEEIYPKVTIKRIDNKRKNQSFDQINNNFQNNSNTNIVVDDRKPKNNKKNNKKNKNKNINDEADGYIPFDEPDEFNLLDYEYRKLAMKFVSENDNFIINSQTISNIDSISTNIDLNLMAQEVLSQELQRKQESLPELQGWIEKKSPTFARGWQKRWVIVREYNIFYGKNKTDIKDTKNEKERKKFLNAIPLLVVQYIVGTDHSRSGRKFEIVARDPRTGDRRHYQWKAATREECDKWVNGLNEHKKLWAARLQFLANTGDHEKNI